MCIGVWCGNLRKERLGRHRRRWEYNIKTDFREVGCGCVDWMELAQDRDRWRALVSAVMNFRVSKNAGNFLTSCRPVSFPRIILLHGVSVCVCVCVCVYVVNTFLPRSKNIVRMLYV